MKPLLSTFGAGSSDFSGIASGPVEKLFRSLAKLLGSIYEKSNFDFGDNKFREDLNSLFQKGFEIREVRGSKQFIFFNRITFGLVSILMKLEARIETREAREIILNADC